VPAEISRSAAPAEQPGPSSFSPVPSVVPSKPALRLGIERSADEEAAERPGAPQP
jgi:hypothetical protein